MSRSTRSGAGRLRGGRAALNLYAHEPDVFDDDAQLTAGLFGVQAAMLLYGSEQAAHLDRALATRDLIGQAKGILMERFSVGDEEAFRRWVASRIRDGRNTTLTAHRLGLQ